MSGRLCLNMKTAGNGRCKQTIFKWCISALFLAWQGLALSRGHGIKSNTARKPTNLKPLLCRESPLTTHHSYNWQGGMSTQVVIPLDWEKATGFFPSFKGGHYDTPLGGHWSLVKRYSKKWLTWIAFSVILYLKI